MISWAERAKIAIGQKGRHGTAKTDETAVARLLAVSSVPHPSVFQKRDSSISFIEHSDCWCWPHSSAMSGGEIDLFSARHHRFTDKGLPSADGATLVDKLMIRDREPDNRRVCLECIHLTGHGASTWRCGNWQGAGVALRARDAQLATALVIQLQRCDGFAAVQGREHGPFKAVC
jgi:hypothetical protein